MYQGFTHASSQDNDDICECQEDIFRKSTTYARIPSAILYIQGVLTVVLNVLLCLSILSSRKLRTFPNYLLLSNSVADIAAGFYLMPFTNVRWSVSSCHATALMICRMSLTTGWYLFALTIVHWATIAVERALRIFHVTLHKKLVGRGLFNALVVTGLCWLFPVTYTYIRIIVPWAADAYPYTSRVEQLTFNNDTDTCQLLMTDHCDCNFCSPTGWQSVGLLFPYLLPLVLAFICYGWIIVATCRRVRVTNRQRQELYAERIRDSLDRRQTTIPLERFFSSPEFRSIRLFLIILLVVAANFTQYMVVRIFIMDTTAVLMVAGEPRLPPEGYFFWYAHGTLAAISDAITYGNSLANPILLISMGRNFRKSLANLLCSCYGRRMIENPLNSRWNELANRLDRETISDEPVRRKWPPRKKPSKLQFQPPFDLTFKTIIYITFCPLAVPINDIHCTLSPSMRRRPGKLRR